MDFGIIPTDETNVSFDYHVMAGEYDLGINLHFTLPYPRTMKGEIRLEINKYDLARI